MKKNKLIFELGNALMAFSFLFLAFIYYPIFEVYFFSKPLPKIEPNSFAIEIPKINVYAPIIANVDPFNSRVYHDVLTRGVALSSTGVFPGESGTVYIFAHSSDAPWRITRYNTVFFKIGELKKNDAIDIFYKNHTYKYLVTGQKTVWPEEVDYITKTKKNQLILQTCIPIGTSLQRLLIFAKPD